MNMGQGIGGMPASPFAPGMMGPQGHQGEGMGCMPQQPMGGDAVQQQQQLNSMSSIGAPGGRPPSLPPSGPLTPSAQPGGPGTPLQQNGSHPLSHAPASASSGPGSAPGSSGSAGGAGPIDLNFDFDPALMNGVDNNANGLDLLPDILSDQELSMYLGADTDAVGNVSGPTGADDILSLFDQAD